MLFAIDIGNTNMVLGVFDGDRLTQSWRLATMRERTADEIGILVTRLFEQNRLDVSMMAASSCRRWFRRSRGRWKRWPSDARPAADDRRSATNTGCRALFTADRCRPIAS
jgi:hypothetical protein